MGAGPGDPDLLTVKAHRLLSDASNLVIVDRLVSEEILEIVQGEVKRANKYPGCAEQVSCVFENCYYITFQFVVADIYIYISIICVALLE